VNRETAARQKISQRIACRLGHLNAWMSVPELAKAVNLSSALYRPVPAKDRLSADNIFYPTADASSPPSLLAERKAM